MAKGVIWGVKVEDAVLRHTHTHVHDYIYTGPLLLYKRGAARLSCLHTCALFLSLGAFVLVLYILGLYDWLMAVLSAWYRLAPQEISHANLATISLFVSLLLASACTRSIGPENTPYH